MEIKFGFENLTVWQKSIELSKLILEITDSIHSKNRYFRLAEQLQSASTSVALNIAEGKGRYSKKEFIHFLYVARGSLYETLTLLIILTKYNLISSEKLDQIKGTGNEINKMLSCLIKSLKNSTP